jgi:hypothetical protein
MKRAILKTLKWGAGAAVIGVALLASPIVYVETFCRGSQSDQAFAAVITDPEWTRNEAATWLTYPEWHIVYAYEEIAQTLRDGDEHNFGYLPSIAGFWSSYCELNRVADAHGGVDGNTRAMIYTIGASFTVEMAFKAIYEETVGRTVVAIRGPEKTPQDKLALQVADDYARFLHQVPWYKYPFAEASRKLAATDGGGLRGMERKLALGGEWKAKQLYAGVIANAVEAAGQAKTQIRAVVEDISSAELAAISGVEVVSANGDRVLFQAPRYREFTEILQSVSAAGGSIAEIAGNDDILVTVLASDAAVGRLPLGRVLYRTRRQGFGDERLLVGFKVAELAEFMRQAEDLGVRIEHVYDY